MLDDVEWETCLLEPHRDRALERDVRRQLGAVPPLLPYLAIVPWVGRAIGELAITDPRHLDRHLTDLVALVVAEDNSCRYCYAAQRIIMRLQGFSADRIRHLEERRFASHTDQAQAIALDFARVLSRADPRLAGERERLHTAGWSPQATWELAFVAAFNVFMNRIATVPALPVAGLERTSRRAGLELLAPLVRLLLRPRARPGERPLSIADCAGPFAFVVERLASHPAGARLRRVLDAAFASPVLPRRSKLLVFAVIARTLRCPHSEREASGLLADSGLAPAALEETLRHLHSPALDPDEAAIIPFARETVRCQPARIQRRARELAARLGREQLVELIGVAALGNLVCRLGLATGAAA